MLEKTLIGKGLVYVFPGIPMDADVIRRFLGATRSLGSVEHRELHGFQCMARPADTDGVVSVVTNARSAIGLSSNDNQQYRVSASATDFVARTRTMPTGETDGAFLLYS